jgi:hypothetical protein
MGFLDYQNPSPDGGRSFKISRVATLLSLPLSIFFGILARACSIWPIALDSSNTYDKPPTYYLFGLVEEQYLGAPSTHDAYFLNPDVFIALCLGFAVLGIICLLRRAMR